MRSPLRNFSLKAGFSLVETALALGIVGFAFTTIFSLISVGMTTFRDTVESTVRAKIVASLTNRATQTEFTSLVGANSAAAPFFAGTNAAQPHYYYFTDEGTEITPANGGTVPTPAQLATAIYTAAVYYNQTGPAGTTLRVRHAEILDAKGWPYTQNLRTAAAADAWTLRGGGGAEAWEPRFTFHGFRYVEVKTSVPVADLLVQGVVLHSPLPPTGTFECSDGLVNQLQHNIRWGQKGNFLEVPTDCPQRDERLGWTGDAQVFIRTAAFNAQVAPFFIKWQRDLDDAQPPGGAFPAVAPNGALGTAADGPGADGGPAWADAAVICPWTVYLCYGDRRILERHYPRLAAFGDYLHATSRAGMRCFEGAPCWKGFGDWLAWDGSSGVEGGTPKDLLGTAFYAGSSHLLARIARVLGREEDAARFGQHREEARAAFQREFVSPAGRLVSATQTAAVLALHFDLLPPAARPVVAAALAADVRRCGNRLSTGFVGTPYLPHVLSAHGYHDVAYDLLHQTTWPSWLYAVTQGATTIWERWNGWTHDQGFADHNMNSFNHYAYGAVGDWLYAVVAGLDLDPERPGYRHVRVRPRPGGKLTTARAALETPRGLAESGWRVEGDRFFLDVRIPPNATGEVRLPEPFTRDVEEGGRAARDSEGVAPLVTEDGGAAFGLVSGEYHFTAATAPG